MELTIAREVIARWNAEFALKQKRILLPLQEESLSPFCIDLLIAFFCNSADAALDQAVAEAEQGIDAHLRAGKPALVFFSEARVDLARTHGLQAAALDEFKRRSMMATVDSYGDEKEFRAKLARHLETVLATHEHFKLPSEASPAPAVLTPKPLDPRRTGPLSPWAQTILVEACDDFEAYIGHIKVGQTVKIQANGKQLVQQTDAESIAKWESAFQELLAGEFIRDVGCNGQLFQISPKGFEFLKTLGKSPVGYIAEMGGM